MDDDIDHEKAAAILEQLEAEKARRLQARIDSSEAISVRATVVIGPDDDAEDATAKALANLPTSDPEGRAISDEGIVSQPSAEPAASGPSCSRPTYVRVTIRNGNDDGDPGAIAEAYYTIEDGVVVLRDRDDKHMSPEPCLRAVTRPP